MWQLYAVGRAPQQRAKLRLEAGQTYVVGRSTDCDFPVPWEQFLSRAHVSLKVDEQGVQATRLPGTTNPIYLDGEPQAEFRLTAGQRFVIGESSFLLQQLQPVDAQPDLPFQQITFSAADLQHSRYEDADRRLEALARLPSVIATSQDQEEQGTHLAELILAGIRHAEAVAVVVLSPSGTVKVTAWERRAETQGSVRPSARLVQEAMHNWHSVVHVWEKNSAALPEENEYTLQAEFDWAFCTPVARTGADCWGIYVTGRLDEPLSESHPLQINLQSDIRFAQLVGEVLSSTERQTRMEGQLSILRQFLSPPILAALEETGHDGNLNVDLLQPRVCPVTVLFCDVRGSSHRAEEMTNDLPGLLDRVNRALAVMTDAIIQHGGVTGDFLGDAVLGFWGWPFPSEDAPVKACRAAIKIREQFLQMQRSHQHPLADFRVGIGVAHGRAVAGKVGTGGRISVTVFGPVVNLASRLEGMTKRLNVPIILDEATAQIARHRLPTSEGRLRQLATVLPYGMENPLLISELLPPVGEYSQLSDADLAMFERGVELFRAGRWQEAYHALHELPSSDQAQDFLLALIAQHNRVAPPGWKGIIELASK
ncbi:adenylate/guanylate cyclase domain-containing protein [Planctomicrobium piriforme]|uniref:Adenylate cyclase n=1 Tax=Planctomicrobium piriforme TaxID=1576369 RepID=A0A1I3DA65_9PLAN|nr:adenylate/guanylate cyclase domain-containing protein [Planctomicrobium piriforme]SFH83401.1 adenylate cyclase [Planctomicrobium piriforme]